MSLSKNEINQRLIRLRNLERLYIIARGRIVSLEKENKVLKQRVKELEDKNTDQNGRIEALSFQFEQIKNKLFGKKPDTEKIFHKKEKEIRDTFSYQRPIPTHITKTETHPVSECSDCHGKLKNKSVKIFFEEDIPLPIQKIVIKHEVEVGYCSVCKKQWSGCHIPSKKSVLGSNLKKYVCILGIANRLSHTQIQDHINDVFEQGKFAWVATGTENNDTVFSLGKSRGGGNIEDIGTAKLGITDDYGAYKNAFLEHQLCWAHPHRKLRDMAESKEFGKRKKKRIFEAYGRFSSLYHGIQKLLKTEISPYLQRKFKTAFNQISESHSLDPTSLSKLKVSLRKNKNEYFTFLKHPGIPIDNNKAERALRHLVIKRRTSFGSKTQRGAETTSILASVILSLKWNNPESWFQEYLALTA